jgi:hypothetical protein
MGARFAAAALGALALIPAASAVGSDIYFQTSHFANGGYDSIKVLRFDLPTRTLSTVVDDTRLPMQNIFARADGTLLLADPNKVAVVSPAGAVRRLHFRVPGVRLTSEPPRAAGFLPSGGAAYGITGAGIYRAGPGLDGRLRLLRGSRAAERPTGHIAAVVAERVVRDGSVIGQVQTVSPGGRFALTRFQRFDPRTGTTRVVVSQHTIMHRMQGSVWGTLPAGGIVVATGNNQNTVFWTAKPRAGRWAVHRFGPAWQRPVDDGAIAVAGLPGGDLVVVRAPTADNGGFVLDEGLQILRIAPGGARTVLYDVPPRADADSFVGGLTVQS